MVMPVLRSHACLLTSSVCRARAGDTTANLWWRLQNGELPTAAPPKAAVIMIGTNDLGYAEACFRSEQATLDAVPGTAARWLPGGNP